MFFSCSGMWGRIATILSFILIKTTYAYFDKFF